MKKLHDGVQLKSVTEWLLVASAYALLGGLGLILAIPPGYASPIFPAAGFALVVALTVGPRILPGVWLGSLILNIIVAWSNAELSTTTFLVSCGIACGSCLQTWFGLFAVKRWLGDNWRLLQQERDIAKFLLLGGPISCLTSASIGVLTLATAGLTDSDEAIYAWWHWYVGDTLGVLLIGPLVLTFIHRHSAAWTSRLPLVVGAISAMLLIVATAFYSASRWENESASTDLNTHGQALANALQSRLTAHEEVVSSLSRFISIEQDFETNDFEYFTLSTLAEQPDILALSFNPLVLLPQRAAFEKKMSALSLDGSFQIKERNVHGELVVAGTRPSYVPVGFIAPFAKNRQAIGYDISSDPRRRDALERSLASGKASATVPIRLVQEDKTHNGILIVKPSISQKRISPNDRHDGDLLGFAVAVINVGKFAELASRGKLPDGLFYRLEDRSSNISNPLLYSSDDGRSKLSLDNLWHSELRIADRTWLLTLVPTTTYLKTNRTRMAWAVGVFGLLATSILQIMLLSITGRSAVIAKRVSEQTLEIQTQSRALAKNEARYRSVVDTIKEVVFQTDLEGRWTFLNQAWHEITGFKINECLGVPALNFVHRDDYSHTNDILGMLIRNETDHCRHRFRIVCSDSSTRWIEMFVRSTANDNESSQGLTGSLSDVTERYIAESNLRLSASVFKHSHEGIMLTDAANKIIDVNDAFTHISGYSRTEVLGRNPSLLSAGRHGAEFYSEMWERLHRNDYWQGELWNRRKNGEVYPELLTISIVRDSDHRIQHYVGVFADISTYKRHEQELEHMAHYDALTRLPNRVLLMDRLQQAMAQASRQKQQVVLVYIDLDGFKRVNDTYGHAAGDQLLVVVSNRMKSAIRECDTIARLGGDEFAVVVGGVTDIQDTVAVLNRLLSFAVEPVTIGNITTQVSASLGVTCFPQDGEADADQLMRQADQAMYQAKLAGKNRYHFFDTKHDVTLRAQHSLAERLLQAIANDELVLYYQPKVNMRTGSILGAEALIRWQHPDEGLLPPSAFLPKIASHPAALLIDKWVISSAISQLVHWLDLGIELRLGVNISAPHLQEEGLIRWVQQVLQNHSSLPDDSLCFEILETSILSDAASISRTMNSCSDLGIRFSLDDFGTGYSSLSHLRHLPVSELKIDRSFVQGMLQDREDLTIVSGVIGLAKAFRRDVIAEGVETLELAEKLMELGCDCCQGFYIARPMPAANVPGWVRDWHLRWRQTLML